MAPRWIPTKEHSPGMFPPNHAAQDDWLLVSGGWVVGRVVVAAGHRLSNQFNWSLTGPKTPEAPVAIGGTAAGAEAAKAALLASWRAWQAWAGMRDEASPLRPEQRPQDPYLDGRGLTFKTLEHGGTEPDTMPNAVRVTDPHGRSAVYVVVDAARDRRAD